MFQWDPSGKPVAGSPCTPCWGWENKGVCGNRTRSRFTAASMVFAVTRVLPLHQYPMFAGTLPAVTHARCVTFPPCPDSRIPSLSRLVRSTGPSTNPALRGGKMVSAAGFEPAMDAPGTRRMRLIHTNISAWVDRCFTSVISKTDAALCVFAFRHALKILIAIPPSHACYPASPCYSQRTTSRNQTA